MLCKFIENVLICFFGLVQWQQRSFSYALDNFFYKGWFGNTVQEDKWLGHTTLRERYLGLYNIIRHKIDTIVAVMVSSPR
jgi:hypothetical protein